ncbi:MAG: hypothetical protein QME52_13210 [Bacteroidota bacterium]|nr:hypothetical protein [Bacteroidota bacterium]
MVKKRRDRRIQDNLSPSERILFTQHQGARNSSVKALQREIQNLKQSLTEREKEIWTLKQMLLYR